MKPASSEAKRHVEQTCFLNYCCLGSEKKSCEVTFLQNGNRINLRKKVIFNLLLGNAKDTFLCSFKSPEVALGANFRQKCR